MAYLTPEDMSEEEINAIIGLGSMDERAAALQQQLALAQKLRNSPGPEGRDSGRVYTAANPLEHIAHAWQGIRAQKEADALRKQQEEQFGKQDTSRGAFYRALMNRRTPGINPGGGGGVPGY